MAENTKIEWADATVNHWAGCTKVSPACDNCYAERMAGRLWKVQWGAGAARRQFISARDMLEALDRKAQRIGKKLRVFHNSLSDMFDNEVPDGWRMDAFKIMADTPNLQHLVLTKRIGNVRHYTQHDGLAFDLMGDGSVWLGVTVVNQEEADRDIPKLLAVPAAKRFLSIEPMLGPVDLNYVRQRIQAQRSQLARAINGETWLDWVIVGSESGPGARPIHPDWARSIRDQCAAAGVPFLFKQWGEWRPMTHADLTTLPASTPMAALKLSGEFLRPFCQDNAPFARMVRVGKAAAGRLLDGRTHDGFPATSDG